ncbi:uncharacterized protein F4807DRAFT_98524 [Annulohypoxylon truncatum]|uniref:uncharacterized protein n=1 Tax=Annulohypoxylon truncatum TaxID=327061 RepID=UPI0020084900|nr:uncharacterized protein F4807DRAFT_98524 [Annulohypoxylon truncatum]KAI1209153.1 hypothetical protein F4807DRAFT_98524 [Annulohypoxylon truncatum]
MPHLTLHIVEWELYPRRILIYLHEKGLLKSKHIAIVDQAPWLGTPLMRPVPSLELSRGRSIGPSVAIIEYFEDICDNPQEEWQKELAAMAKPSMRGTNLLKRAEMRGVYAIIEEASVLFNFASLRGSRRHAPVNPTNSAVANMALGLSKRSLSGIQDYYSKRFRDNFDDHDYGRDINIADIALFSLVEYAKELYGQNLVAGLLNLKRFYMAFDQRESAKRPHGFYPDDIVAQARDWN